MLLQIIPALLNSSIHYVVAFAALKLDDVKPQLAKQEDTKPSQAEIAAVAQQQQHQQQHHQQAIQVCQVPGHNFSVNQMKIQRMVRRGLSQFLCLMAWILSVFVFKLDVACNILFFEF